VQHQAGSGFPRVLSLRGKLMSGITDRCERRRVCAAIGTRFLKWMIKGRAAPRKGEQGGGESERQRPRRAAAVRGEDPWMRREERTNLS